jgi:hypothetical protein
VDNLKVEYVKTVYILRAKKKMNFRKIKLIKLKLTVRPRISEISKEALLALRGFTSLELIHRSVRRVICLQGPTVLCLDAGFISLSY